MSALPHALTAEHRGSRLVAAVFALLALIVTLIAALAISAHAADVDAAGMTIQKNINGEKDVTITQPAGHPPPSA